ncbi:MAG: methylthioribulose 1-phosphate dehydratase [Nitrospirae bacterium]|nr:methylthioribulose 1-phosphate dehydratase [Nitrospirota bacterium]
MTKNSATQKNRAALLCRLLRRFYDKDWVSGTGGGICAATGPKTVLMAPTGVHKEEVRPSDLFVVDRMTGGVIRPPRNRSLAVSECNPIFCLIMTQRKVGSVMHSHALSAVLAADLSEDRDHFIIEGLEMLKGVRGVSNQAKHAVPVIRNTPRERELVDQIRRALEAPVFSESFCILVRNHGAYIWGEDLWEAKRHAEIYHFLFEAVVARSRRGRNGWGQI